MLAEQQQQRQAVVKRRAEEAGGVSSLREPSGKTSGRQKGHPGETLRRTETPEATIDHYPQICATCGAALTAAMATDHVVRQVFDLPEPRPLKHQAYSCRCAACDTRRLPASARTALSGSKASPILCATTW
jgi:hypothetical protein